MIDSSRENLRTRYLPEREIAFIREMHPEVDSSTFCPTCGGAKLFMFRSKRNRSCDCELQRQLYKWYLSAGIPVLYQRLDWRDFNGDKAIKQAATKYMRNFEKYLSANIGLLLNGSNGAGKTYVLTMLLKDALCKGYSCFFTTADDLFAMKTDGWGDSREKDRFNKKVKNSKILVIDDVGKEFGNRLTKQILESLLRYRVQNSLTTLMSSNRSVKELEAEYGGSFASLLKESYIVLEVNVDDFRPVALQQKLEEVDLQWTRPLL